MKYLVDTNVWLQGILGREFADDVSRLFVAVPAGLLATTDLALHSVPIRVTPDRSKAFKAFLDDLIARRVNTLHLPASDLYAVLDSMDRLKLDFDDAFQYHAAERYALRLISFDKDFDHTPRGRLTPAQVLAELRQGPQP